MNNAATKPLLDMTNPSQIGESAAWLAILASAATLLLLAALRVLSPGFSPSKFSPVVSSCSPRSSERLPAPVHGREHELVGANPRCTTPSNGSSSVRR